MDLRLVVDPIRCDGYGMCAELLPELVELDDWGFPMIRRDAVPGRLLDHARRAVDVCPVLALRLQSVGLADRRSPGDPPPGDRRPGDPVPAGMRPGAQ